jgi:uncharacterized protein (DUF1810 family)
VDDTFDLQRFVDAQQPVFDNVLAELAAGAKASHWMWFVFPQLRALGRSATARHYGIASLAEARAYLAHALLGARLKSCCEALLRLDGRSAPDIFGTVDTLKLCSCMTLFERAAADVQEQAVFSRVLEKYFGGRPDAATQALL